jgi:hypothetical protein
LLAPFVRNVVCEFVVAFRSSDVGLGGKDLMLPPFFVGGGNRFEFLFDLSFAGRRGGSKAEDGVLPPSEALAE